MLQVTTWLSPLSTEGAAQNVPAFLSVEAILLQKAQAASFQVHWLAAPAAPAAVAVSVWCSAFCSMPQRPASAT